MKTPQRKGNDRYKFRMYPDDMRNRKTQKAVAYGSGCVDVQGNWQGNQKWHPECHEPMKQKRGQYMLSLDRVLYLGWKFEPTDKCAHCGKSFPH